MEDVVVAGIVIRLPVLASVTAFDVAPDLDLEVGLREGWISAGRAAIRSGKSKEGDEEEDDDCEKHVYKEWWILSNKESLSILLPSITVVPHLQSFLYSSGQGILSKPSSCPKHNINTTTTFANMGLLISITMILLSLATLVIPQVWHAGPWSSILVTTYEKAECKGKSHDYNPHFDDINHNKDTNPLFASYRLRSLAHNAKEDD
ncbi:MAG: hypothetical protein Q9225_006478 [Loekoesia sp. 1 TL-2023]